MLKLFLWLRNLRKKKIVLLSVMAVALSCALLIVVASIFSGFIKAVENSGSDLFGDIMIRPPVQFSGYEQLVSQIEQLPDVATATAVLQSQGLLHIGEGNVRGVSVFEIDPVGRAAVMDFKSALVRQKHSVGPPSFAVADDPNAAGIFLGIGVLAEPNEQTDEYDFRQAQAMIGQSVVLTTGAASMGTAQSGEKTFRARVIPFKVADIVFTGVYQLDSEFVYVPLKVLQEKLSPHQTPSADLIQIKLKTPADADAAVARVQTLFEKFAQDQLNWNTYLISQTHINSARRLQQDYIQELRKQMGLLLVIFGAASLGVIMLIFCILYMIVITKQKDIAVLKSCGSSNVSIAMLFVSYGIFVGAIGSAVGAVIGYYFVKNINTVEHWITIIFGFKIWKSSVYLFSKIPNELDVGAMWWIMIAAVAATAVGALIPAIAAARTRPVKILRYE